MATGALRSDIRIASFHRFVWNTRGLTGQSPLPERARSGSPQNAVALMSSARTAPRMVMASDGDWRLEDGHTIRFVPPLCLTPRGLSGYRRPYRCNIEPPHSKTYSPCYAHPPHNHHSPHFPTAVPQAPA